MNFSTTDKGMEKKTPFCQNWENGAYNEVKEGTPVRDDSRSFSRDTHSSFGFFL